MCYSEIEEPSHVFIKNKNDDKERELFIWCAFSLYHVLFSEKIKATIRKMAPKNQSKNKPHKLIGSIKSLIESTKFFPRLPKKTKCIEKFYEEKVNFIIKHFDPIKLFYKICANNFNIYLFDDLTSAKKFNPVIIAPAINYAEKNKLAQAFKRVAKKITTAHIIILNTIYHLLFFL